MDASGFQKKQKNMCSWSELPGDLLVEIAVQVLSSSADDFTRFRKVCTSWRAAATKELFVAKFSKPRPSIPYIMLPEKEGSNEREFYSLVSKKIFMTLPLPEAHGKRCIEVRFGWLLTLTNSGEVKLLNPITRAQIDLPNFSNFSKYPETVDLDEINGQFEYKVRAVLSANPSHSSDFVLAVVSKANRDLGFWKNGDEDWTTAYVSDEVDPNTHFFPIDVTYHSKDNKFYAVSDSWDHTCYIYVLDPVVSSVAEMLFAEVPDSWIPTGTDVYIVESSAGELLLVKRNGQEAYRRTNKIVYGATEFNVFRVDVDEKIYEEIQSLEDEAIFVGYNASFSIPASKHPGGHVIKPNCIYFSDDSFDASYSKSNSCIYFSDDSIAASDFVSESENEIEDCLRHGELEATNYKGGGKNMGIYNLQDRSIQRFHQSVERLSFICPPLWISLSSLFS